MHKAVILLVPASNREEAKGKSEEFLKEYGGDKVWDWYVIGGRWSGTLNPKHAEFDKLAREIVPAKDDFISQQDVDSKQPELQRAWMNLGQDGPNPWANHYKNVPEEGGLYDIMPLADCITVVNDWQQDPKEAGDKEVKEGNERWGVSADKPDLNMYGYSLKIAGSLYSQDFSFNCNVFNTNSWNFSLPESPDDWWAVIVDMHT